MVKVSTVTRVGNRDVMRVRPFIRISGNLSMTTSDLSAKIPPFNAQRMLTDVGSAAPAASDDPNAADAAEPDAEVSFVTKDLATVLPKAKLAAVVALDEILLRVRDAANWRGAGGGVRYTALANATADASGGQSDMKLAYATEGNVSADPYAGFETRVVPENVTLLAKTKEQITGGNPSGERVHVVKKGDTVTSILRDQGATPDEAKAIAATLGPKRPRRRPEGRPEAAHPDGAGSSRARGAAAALSRDRRQRHHDRSRRRAVGHRQIRRRRRAEHEYRRRGARQPRTTMMMMTAPASGSTRAFTRPRCATRCRTASSRT